MLPDEHQWLVPSSHLPEHAHRRKVSEAHEVKELEVSVEVCTFTRCRHIWPRLPIGLQMMSLSMGMLRLIPNPDHAD